MASKKLNVLVYSGSGATVESVKHALYTLRRLLAPNYAVSTIGETALLKEPWAPTCALLVMPGGADLGYCRVLNGDGNAAITSYVRRGGRYLGFCAGGYYGSGRCEFEVGNRALEVVGRRELAFFPGTCRGGAFKGFRYHSEAGARAATLKVRHEELVEDGTKDAEASLNRLPQTVCSYYNGGGVFVDAVTMKSQGVQVLAEYADAIDVDGGGGRAAVVLVKVGNGQALLTGPHPEFSHVLLSPQPEVAGYDKLVESLAADEEPRTTFFKSCLAKIGLDVTQDTAGGGGGVPSLSVLHLSSADPQEVSELLHSLGEIITKTENGAELIRAESNTFQVVNPSSPAWSMTGLQEAIVNHGEGEGDGSNSAEEEPRHLDKLYAHEEGWPEAKETPSFNHEVYFSSLKDYRKKESGAYEWGDSIIYGEVVTSTNTLLEKNPKLLAKLPTGFSVTATTQTSGRGRGSNVWVAPPGQLIMSTVINHPAHLASTRPIVFIQYLAAIAIVEAIQSYDKGYGDLPVKLKWPNDIYCRDPTQPANPPQYVKIGGLLSNCAYSAGNYQVVLGIGINTSNGRPTTSLDALAAEAGLPPFRVERLLARLLTRLEALYGEFVSRGFSRNLEERYYARWLHTDQVVTLEAEGGVRARVLGITRDWGLLRAEELGPGDRPLGRVWALQSDENSFDFWKGLVRRKL